MTSMLAGSDSRPRSDVRPTGTSFVGLVGVELRRLWWRRLTKAVIVAIFAVVGMATFSIYQETTPENIAQRVDEYHSMVEQMQRDQAQLDPAQKAQQLADCKKSEAQSQQDGAPADFGCDHMFDPPTLQQFGLTNLAKDEIIRSIAVEGFYVFAFLAFILGASFVAAEYATGSLGNWLTFVPRRVRVATSKLVAATLAGVGIATVAIGLAILSATMITTINRPDSDLALPDGPSTGTITQELLRVGVVVALGGLGGAVIGILLRSTAGVIGTVLAWTVVAEGLIASELSGGRWQPWFMRTNVESFVHDGSTYYATVCKPTECMSEQLTNSYTHGWVYLVIVSALGVAAALLAFRRRDVS